jgi:hypothetical protein
MMRLSCGGFKISVQNSFKRRYSGIVATKKRGPGRPQVVKWCPYCSFKGPTADWRVHVGKCPDYVDRPQVVVDVADHERETILELVARGLDSVELAIDGLRGPDCAEGRRLEQDWGRRFRALRKKLKGER